jgi:outer membrane protein assembly factor BamE (lipoprotein component of BamABCDE complex)
MKKIITSIAIALSMSALIGCAANYGSQAFKNETETSINSKIKVNITTKDDLKKMFGAPTATDITESGFAKWVYVIGNAKIDLATVIPFVGLFTGGSQTDSKELTIIFNKNNTVKAFDFNETQVVSKSGISNQ